MVHFLNANDFGLNQGHLMTKVNGILFVMFTTKDCRYCHEFMPIFQSLQGTVVGMNFGVCNVDGQNRVLVEMSLNSSTPIKGAPTFILYNNGVPFANYKGARTQQSVMAFIREMISKINQSSQFSSQPPQQVLRSRQNPGMTQAQSLPQSHQGRVNPEFQQQMTGQSQMPQPAQAKKYTLSPTTGVKEFETSYGRPYNTTNEQEFLDYEQAYLEQQTKR